MSVPASAVSSLPTSPPGEDAVAHTTLESAVPVDENGDSKFDDDLAGGEGTSGDSPDAEVNAVRKLQFDTAGGKDREEGRGGGFDLGVDDAFLSKAAPTGKRTRSEAFSWTASKHVWTKVPGRNAYAVTYPEHPECSGERDEHGVWTVTSFGVPAGEGSAVTNAGPPPAVPFHWSPRRVTPGADDRGARVEQVPLVPEARGGREGDSAVSTLVRSLATALTGVRGGSDVVKHFKGSVERHEASDVLKVANFLRLTSEATDDLAQRAMIVQRHAHLSTTARPARPVGDSDADEQLWRAYVARVLHEISRSYVRHFEAALTKPTPASLGHDGVADYLRLRTRVYDIYATWVWIRSYIGVEGSAVGVNERVRVDCLVRSLPTYLQLVVNDRFDGEPDSVDKVHSLVIYELAKRCDVCGCAHSGRPCAQGDGRGQRAQHPQPYRVQRGTAAVAFEVPAGAHDDWAGPQHLGAASAGAHADWMGTQQLGAAPVAGLMTQHLQPALQQQFALPQAMAYAGAHADWTGTQQLGAAPQAGVMAQHMQPVPQQHFAPPQAVSFGQAGLGGQHQIVTQAAAFAQPRPRPPDFPPPSNPGQDRACFTCKRSGHLSRDCPDTRCWACGNTGHRSNVCPSPRPGGSRGCRRDGCNGEVHLLADCPNYAGCKHCGSKSHLSHACPNAGSGNGRR